MIDFFATEKDIKENKTQIIKKLAEFSFSDVLLFWSGNEDIKKIQNEKWSPILHWIDERFALKMEKTETLKVLESNEQNRKSFEDILDEMPIRTLSCFYLAAVRMQSPLLALALVENKITASEAFELSYLEEIYQNQKWGSDLAAENKRQSIKNELQEIEKYLKNNGNLS